MLNLKTVIWRSVAFLDCWHWVLLTLAVPFLLFPSPTRSLALLIIPVVWIIAWLIRPEPLPRTPLNGTMLLFSFMVLVSLYATYDIVVSLPRFSGIVLAIGVFYAVAREAQKPGGWWLSFLVFVGVGVVFAGLGLLGTQWLKKISFLAPVISRLPTQLTNLSGSGQGFHPNQIAGTLLWIVPVLLALLVLLLVRIKTLRAVLDPKSATMLILAVGIITLFVTGVFGLTQSRGGYLGFFLAGIVVLLIILPLAVRRILAGVFVIFVTIGGIVLIQQGGNTVWGGISDSQLASNPALSLSTLEGRLELWSRAIYAIQDFPFTGMGMNTFRYVVHVLYPLFLISPNFDLGHAHNEYLQAALDLGIPGLIAFLALYIGAFWMLRQIWKIAKGPVFNEQGQETNPLPNSLPLSRAMVLGLGGGLFAHMLYGFTDAVALGARQSMLFWMLLGLISGLFTQAHSGQLGEWSIWPVIKIRNLTAWNRTL